MPASGRLTVHAHEYTPANNANLSSRGSVDAQAFRWQNSRPVGHRESPENHSSTYINRLQRRSSHAYLSLHVVDPRDIEPAHLVLKRSAFQTEAFCRAVRAGKFA